jgi:methionyl-tRNA synthetase
MSPSDKRYYLTTPIYYVNGQPHIGSALTTISCDAIARYQRLRGREAWFLTGTDENATKVQEAAEKEGSDPLLFAGRLAEDFRECWRRIHIDFQDFIRTTEPRHVRAVQTLFDRLRARGYIYPDTYEGWYSVSDETFFRDSEVKDGYAVESGKPVQRVREENYFFRLSAFSDRLMEQIERDPDWLLPEHRRNEVVAFIREGLRDISITRPNRGWGIPVPGDESKVIYVWFDALISYLAATGWPDSPDWETLWPADLHFMAKEIFVRFHATLWPAMLMALDLPIPKQVFAHGWFTVAGAKGGKTGASLPHPVRFAQFIADRSGASFDLSADALRFLLCREMIFDNDAEFSVESCLRRFNTDLANDLGNLLNRTVNMVVRYFDGAVPAASDHDAEIAALAIEVAEDYAHEMAIFRLNGALEAAMRLVARMNKYIDEKAPWTLAKARGAGDSAAGEELARVLYACLEAARQVSILLSPFMPVAVDAIRSQLGLPSAREARWEDLAWGGLPAGGRVGPPQPIFPRIQELSVDEETLYALGSANPPTTKETTTEVSEPVNTPQNAAAASGPEIGKPVAPAIEPAAEALITFDEFMKVELRVAEVLAAEPVPNATKLLRLTVQLGEDDTRTILAGIAEYYQPDQLVGRKIVVVANLQPRKMRGIESQGMLLAADADGKAFLIQPDTDVPSGSRVR